MIRNAGFCEETIPVENKAHTKLGNVCNHWIHLGSTLFIKLAISTTKVNKIASSYKHKHSLILCVLCSQMDVYSYGKPAFPILAQNKIFYFINTINSYFQKYFN